MKKARKLYTSFEQLPLTLPAAMPTHFCIGKIFRRSGSESE